jgi:hypothetical protein
LTEHGTLEHELRGTDEAALREFLRLVVPIAALFALMLGLALVWVIVIGVAGVVAPSPADPAPWYGKAFQVVTMATATFLTILLFTRYRARLLLAAHGSERCPSSFARSTA